MPGKTPRTARGSGDDLYAFCRSLAAATEDVKWENDLVFSVGGKMFAAFELPAGEPLSFKTDPDSFEVLTRLPGVHPARYLARAHWVTVKTRSALPRVEVEALLLEAHRLVAAKLPRKLRRELGLELGPA
jgi:predicted DNA-binding protein (MmcQ/YjbR family)